MIAVVQRVREAAVSAEGGRHAAIGPGLCILLCAERGDGDAEADWMARKLAQLRIFADEADLMNRSVQETGGSALVVSQFTLAGDCRKGNRPSFVQAAEPDLGRRLYERVCAALREAHGVPVATGWFGAMMQVSLVNDGPVTLIVRREPGG
jgi:D-tyrosyl-tRNA(Tyr) deacylase